MECDSVHSTIERAKRTVPIYAPMNYYTVIARARHKQPYVVHPMGQIDFKDFSIISKQYITNCSKTSTGDTAAWLRMKWMQYRKEAPGTISFKYEYDEPFQEMQVACNCKESVNTVKNKSGHKKRAKGVTATKSMPSIVLPLSPGPIPVNRAKYADLQSLCASLHIPVDYHSFYGSLLHTDSAEAANTDSINVSENETE